MSLSVSWECMKPGTFEYADPRTLDELLAILRDRGDDAKILAGGQSLVPLLNMRLAMPEVVVDINRVAGQDDLKPGDRLSIGMLVRQETVERDDRLDKDFSLLRESIGWVGHPQIRTRGTVLGSLAHADPAAELPVVFQALEGEMEIASASGTRMVPAEAFFTHIMTTAIKPDEVLVRAHLNSPPPNTGTAFLEIARRHGDFAVASVAVSLTVDDGAITSARIAMGGVGTTPLRARQAEEFLVGHAAELDAFAQAGRIAAGEAEPASDIHGSAEYRRELIRVLTRRALEKAAARLAGYAPGPDA
ncbi:MAG TPA: xanthine dehydrogenase family protein subunit M [Chloroflexota bacterium]|jgi:CO/xanthine dehydrogenase FAD-binding subunit|nr:xanthine dehydrogenase family protein subunit M [Chloroflexota bacterium]